MRGRQCPRWAWGPHLGSVPGKARPLHSTVLQAPGRRALHTCPPAHLPSLPLQTLPRGPAVLGLPCALPLLRSAAGCPSVRVGGARGTAHAVAGADRAPLCACARPVSDHPRFFTKVE